MNEPPVLLNYFFTWHGPHDVVKGREVTQVQYKLIELLIHYHVSKQIFVPYRRP